MDQQVATRAGTLLWEAWQGRTQMDALPADCRPGTLEEAYAVQEGLAASAGLAIAGYKIGATNAQVQARFGVDAPFSGRLFADHVGGSPLRVPREHGELLRDRGRVRLRDGARSRPQGRALHAGRGARGGRQRPSRHRGAGFPLRGLALDEGDGPDRRQRHRLHALPSGRRRRTGSTTTSRVSR